MLQAVISAGWIAVASWPIDTERESFDAMGSSRARFLSPSRLPPPRKSGRLRPAPMKLAIGATCWPRCPGRIHDWMPRLAEEGVVGADAIFACLGPALEIFSRYSRVEKASGEVVPLKEYLESVWAAVSHEALSMIFAGASTEGFEPDSRLTAMWLWTLSIATEKNQPPRTQRATEEEDD